MMADGIDVIHLCEATNTDNYTFDGIQPILKNTQLMAVVGSNQYQQLHNWWQLWDPTNQQLHVMLMGVVGSNQFQ